MKNILILYSDGTARSKEEHMLDTKDFCLAEYFLISTENAESSHYRNFAIAKPSSSLIFDTAEIEYQLGLLSINDDEIDIAYQDPVSIKTNSICDVICLINSIDRLNNVNNLIRDGGWYDGGMATAVIFMSVKLYKDGEIFYNKTYSRKDKKEQSDVYTYRATKKFKELYMNNVCEKLMRHDEFIFLIEKGKNLYWERDVYVKKYDMIGAPLPESNTITFCTEYEFNRMKEYKDIMITFNVYFMSNQNIEIITEKIHEGIENEVIEEAISEIADDVYLLNNKFYCLTGSTRYALLDLLAHANFVIHMVYILFSSVYSSDDPFDNEELEYDTCNFDILVDIKLGGNGHGKEFMMNRYSILDTSIVLNLI